MRIRSLAPVLLVSVLAACNYPTPQILIVTATPEPSPTAEAGTPLPPPAAPTRTPTPQPPAPTATVMPTAGPIAHLEKGTDLAITHIDMIDSAAGWATGGAAEGRGKDHVLRTTDGGSTWMDVTPPETTIVDPPTDRIAVAGFWDKDTAWATFYSADLRPPSDAPAVWRTADGGATWTQSAPLDLSGWEGPYRVSDLFLINANTGWVFAHRGDDPKSDRIALFQTVNGGSRWDLVIDPAKDSDVQECEKTGILFTGPWNGWLTGDCRGNAPGTFVYQTFDGGKSWIAAPLPSPAVPPGVFTSPDFACRVHDPVYFAQDTNLVLAVECASKTTPTTGHYLFTSNLDGSNWHTLAYPGGLLVVRSPGDGRVFRGDVGSGLAVGKDMYIFDGKAGTWEKINTIDWSGQFDFVDWNKGWSAAVCPGNLPCLMYTDDGGRNWMDLRPAAG
jgi:photosystem II stability/assembly factor-like uncharacterized protein